MGDRFGLSKDEFYRLAYNAEEGQVLSSVSNDDEIEIEPLEVDKDNAVIQSLEAERQDLMSQFDLPSEFLDPGSDDLDPRFRAFYMEYRSRQAFEDLIEEQQQNLIDIMGDVLAVRYRSHHGWPFYKILAGSDLSTGFVLALWAGNRRKALPSHGTSGRDREMVKMLNFADNYSTEGEL